MGESKILESRLHSDNDGITLQHIAASQFSEDVVTVKII